MGHATIRATIIPEIVKMIAEKYNISEMEALDRFYTSATGANLADGYINNEEETKKRFVPSILDTDKIMYRTGDIAEWSENGELLCYGRIDHQIKHRGYRIELDEINHNITASGLVNDSIVIYNDRVENSYIVCFYCTADNKDISSERFTAALENKLPEYMIPSRWVRLDRLPLNNNDKVDRKALLDMLMANKKKGYYSNSRRTYNNGRIGPRNIVENDYKWFNDKGRNNNKAYSKIHFNLFIDNSGSWSADLEVNQFIRALNEIKSTDFDFDVITINCDIVEWPTSDAYVFRSGGGTNLSNAIAPIIKKHTLPGCQNYNIVVFDGDAHGSCNAADEPFRHFNTTNSILVVDESNAQFIKNLNSCKKQIIRSNYSQHFIAAVLELLERTLC